MATTPTPSPYNALSDLAAMLVANPDHPDSVYWEFRLALGHAGLAWILDGSASAPHWNEAVRTFHGRERYLVADAVLSSAASARLLRERQPAPSPHDGRLPASLLLDQDPTRPLPLDTVVLSACSTHVVGDHYDEAFSLATAFLAAGARTVIGSLWNIPDGPTSRLAFLFHRHRSAGAPPADARRAAQLWMLDPDSDVPDALPALLHTVNVGDIPLHHPLLGAGLTHLGR